MGHNLFTNLNLSLEEAMLGFSRTITHLDGRVITVSSDQVVQPFQVNIITAEGMPKHESYEKGDLHVKYVVTLPRQLSDSQKALVTKMFSQ